MDKLREWLNGKRDYASGVELYEQLGKDLAMKRMFSEPESPFKIKKLVIALESIWNSQKQGLQAISAHPPIQPSNQPAAPLNKELQEIKQELDQVTQERDDVRDQLEDLEWEKENLEEENDELQKKLRSIKSRNGWPVEMDETISSLHAQWKQKFLTMVDLQSRLYEVARAGQKDGAKQKEAGAMALQILDLRDQVIGFYAKRDHYLVEGKLPEEPVAEEKCIDPNLWPLKYENAMKYARNYRAELKAIEETDPKYLKKLQQVQKWEAEAEYYRKLLKKD
jgi:FtsZ-binding cell division protein ZapB